MDLGLDGRVYIVTGGTRGLGHATARCLIDEGAKVVLTGRDPARVESAAADLGGAIAPVAADNADPGTPGRLVQAARDLGGRIDGALISVGGPPAGPIMDKTDEEWTQAFASVFLGGLRLAREIGRELGDGGALALVLSSSVRAPIANLAISNGLRPGLAMAAKNLADELGPGGVRVNGLLPGRVETERVLELDASSGDADAARAANEAAIPLRRYGTPDEFGRVATFLLSPASSFVSGSMVPVDGGMLRAL